MFVSDALAALVLLVADAADWKGPAAAVPKGVLAKVLNEEVMLCEDDFQWCVFVMISISCLCVGNENGAPF